MNKQVFIFHETGAIAGIPNPASPDGLFHAGQMITVDLDTNTVLSAEPLPVTTPVVADAKVAPQEKPSDAKSADTIKSETEAQ